MTELLSYQSIRILNIVEYLMTEKNYTSINHLQKLNNCSRKTVHNDLKHIQTHWSNFLHLDIQRNFVYAQEQNIYILFKMKKEIYAQELSIKILKTIFCHPFERMETYSHLLNYSPSSIRKNIRKINDYIQHFHLKIKMNDDFQYYIEAKDEITLRFFMHNICPGERTCLTWQDLKLEEKKNFYAFVNKHQIRLPHSLEEELKSIYIHAIIRERQGFKDDFFQALKDGKTEGFETIQNALKQALINFLKHEAIQLNMEEFRSAQDILTVVAIHALVLPQSIDNTHNRYHYFYQSFRKENKKLDRSIQEHFKNFQKENEIPITNYIPETIFHVYNAFATRKYKSLCLAVYSDLGIDHSHSLKLFVQKHFPQQKVEIYHHQKNIDFIISTVPLETEKKVILINDYPQANDFKKIYERIYLED